MRLLIAALAGILWAYPALAEAPVLPDASHTPGRYDAAVTNANYRHELCSAVNGKKYHTTDEKRPTSAYTTKMKKQQLKDWEYEDTKPGHYEEDHLVSLELGGDPSSKNNLWPQPYSGKWNAKVKDGLEGELGRRVCLPMTDPDYISLTTARQAIKTDWIKAYAKYVCVRTKPALTDIMRQHCD